MYQTLKYEEIEELQEKESIVFIDVRSPFEYADGTIPNALNIPLLDNEERVHVGTVYKQECAEKARIVGIDYVAKKLSTIYKEIADLFDKYDKIVIFCSRGGYRSQSLVSFINSIGHKVYRLNGGYKAYRRYINQELPKLVKEINFVTLYGNTGVGKTDILINLKENNMNILDLEGHANHRGSMLGGIGLGKQNSQKLFESLVYEELKERNSNIVFTEGESRKIGQIFIPDFLFKAIQESTHIKIEANIDRRVNNILGEYVSHNDDELIETIQFLRRRLGKEKVDEYTKQIKEDKHHLVVKDLMINYYDPMYEYGEENIKKIFFNNNLYKVSENIINWSKDYFKDNTEEIREGSTSE